LNVTRSPFGVKVPVFVKSPATVKAVAAIDDGAVNDPAMSKDVTATAVAPPRFTSALELMSSVLVLRLPAVTPSSVPALVSSTVVVPETVSVFAPSARLPAGSWIVNVVALAFPASVTAASTRTVLSDVVPAPPRLPVPSIVSVPVPESVRLAPLPAVADVVAPRRLIAWPLRSIETPEPVAVSEPVMSVVVAKDRSSSRRSGGCHW
jgi:hypothetical protein